MDVIEGVKAKMEDLKKGLPEGVTIETAYDRSSLIKRAIKTLKEKLLEEAIVVALIILVFLFHLRSSFVAIITLPLGVLLAFVVMRASMPISCLWEGLPLQLGLWWMPSL